VLAPLGQSVILVDLSFDGGASTVAIDVEAPDAAGLQRVAEALKTAGLNAQTGVTQIAPGKASGAFLIRSAR
jgi:type II secretory pathway component PulL